MTVAEYLEIKRQKNPELANFSTFDLYNKLKTEQDPELTALSTIKPSDTKRKGQTSYQRKTDPSFVNSLFDWTDWGINEGSSEWAKSAYNNSITGLSYQLYNGEQKFNLDGYNPGMTEDIFSAVLSFMMPLDFASMFVGGAIGKGLTGLAGAGMKTAAVENLVKANVAKGMSKAVAKKNVENMIKYGGHSALLSSYAPKAAGSIASAATLATFEGTRGGVEAAVNGEDVWKGIGSGVMHGGIMGGVVGAVGASLNVKNAALWNKAKSKTPLTPKEAKQIGFWRTGKGGQVLAEAGVFTAPEIKNVIMDEDYTMRDLFRSFVVNAGMMGVMKVQHKVQGNLWNKGKESIKEYWEKEGKFKIEEDTALADAAKNVSKDSDVDITIEDTAAQKKIKTGAKEATRFEDNQLKQADVSKEERSGWEGKFDQATKDLDRMDSESKNYDPNFKISDKGLHNIYEQIQSVYGAMEKNINYYKKNNPVETKAREAKIQEYQELKDAWKKEVLDKYNDIDTVRKQNEKISPKQIQQGADKAQFTLTEAWEGSTEAQRKNLRKGLEKKISETGEILDTAAYEEIQKRADTLLDIKRKQQPGISFQASQEKTSLNKFKTDKTNIDVFKTPVQDKIIEVEGSTVKTPYEKQLSKETLKFENTIEKSKLSDKIHQKTKGEDFSVIDATKAQEISYNESKDILKYISRELSREITPIEDAKAYLQIADKFTRFLAKNKKAPKSLLEVKAKDIENFVNENPVSYKSGLSNVIKTLTQLNADYPGIIEGGMKYTTGIDIGALYRKRAKGSKMLGLTSTKADLSPTKIDVKNNTLTTGTKTDVKIKPITTELAEKLESLDMKSRENDRPGHRDFLYTDTSNEALITSDANAITKKFLGPRIQPSGGEARASRYSLIQWALKKFGKGTSEYYLIDEFSIGHKSNKKMDATYSEAIEAKGGPRKYTTKIIEEYIADIKRGKYNDASGKEISMRTLNKDIRQTGYYPHEIKKGLENLEKAPDIIKYKVGNKTKYVDKATVETMIRHMIETGPRIREVVPTQKAVDAAIEFSVEGKKTDYQLLSEAKSAEAIVEASTLVDQVKYFKKKFPQLHVAIKKTLGKHRGEYVLGKIQGQLIKIAEGKARIDTLPHEISHYVVDVLREMGDPFSKKLVKDGIKMFKGEEAFVEALGKYSSKLLPKSKMGRVRSWVARAWGHFKQYFGITNRRDVQQMQKEIVRIIGGKVLSGKIPTDVMPLKSRIKVKYQKSGTPTGDKAVKKARGRVEEIEKKLLKDYEFTKEQLEEIGENIIGDKEYDKITVGDIERYENRLRFLADKNLSGQSKKHSLNEVKVNEIEIQYDISKEKRDAFLKDAFNTTIDKANNKMIDIYKSYVIKGKEVKPRSDTAVDAGINLVDGKNMTSVPGWKRAFMTAADVLYYYGGKPGRIISRKLLAHDYTRSILKGEGEVVLERIKKIIVDKKTRNNYMHLIDKDLARGALEQLKGLHKEFESTKEKSERNPYTQELKEIADAINNFSKDGKYHEVRELWEGLSKSYWNTLITNISLNTRGSREFQQIKEALNEKFINQYFARKVTKEALMHINSESPEIQRIIDREFKNLSEKDLKRAANELNINRKDLDFEQQVKNLLAEELMTMIDFGPTKVKPSFLKERGAQLPEYMTITLENGRKKMIKSYETGLDGTIGSYVNGMAKYLSTVKHFPEYTEFSGKFSFKGAGAKLQTLELMSGKRKGTMGAYAAETIKRQLGLDYSNRDILLNPALNIGGKLTNWSAVAGLSSPMSGLKNVFIQIPRSAAIYGVRKTVRAMGYAFKAMRDPKLFEQAMKEGQIGYGTKELIRKEAPLIKWWFDNVNGMTKTENFNRIVLAEAGKAHFAELTNVARGNKSMFHPQGKKSEVIRMFKETWKLSDAEIKFITEGKDIFDTKKYNKILERVGFESHKAGAGATGVSDLPLWFSGKYIKPFTLFQRMATSVTIDSYKNYVKPLKNGNAAPLLKATLGHMLSGAALYGMYDALMGQQISTEENPALDRAISYVWRGEFLGMFGEIISPYDKGLSVPIMEPIIYRNVRNAWSEFSQFLNYGKGADQALKDFTLKSIVLANQAKRTFDNFNHPYSTEYKRIKTLRSSFNNAMGYEMPQGNFISSRQPYYWKLKTAIMYGQSDSDIALAYYNAFNYICSDYEEGGVTSRSHREKKARQAIEAVIRHMHPINLPDDSDNRRDSKRNEFLGYLSPKNKALALKLEKEFKYKERQFYKIIGQYKWKKKHSIYAYH